MITDRQLEIMRLINTGATYKETGQMLSISTETVRSTMQRIFKRLVVENKIEAINKLRDKGFL